MDEEYNVLEQLKSLIASYNFNIDTLSKYLKLSVEQIKELAQGNIDVLPDENIYRFQVFNKIQFLYMSAMEDKDLKLNAFLKVLISQHSLSKKTIAKMAGVETNDIEMILSDSPKRMENETKYKIAVTVMSLRFFLKDCEPPMQL